MGPRVAVSTPRRAVRHAPAGLAGEHRQAQAHRAAVVAGPQRFVLVLSPPAGGVVPGSQTVFEACSAGRAVAWLEASSSAGGSDHFWLQCLLFYVAAFPCSGFFAAYSRGTAARARFFGLQCLRGCLLLVSQPFNPTVFVSARVRHNVRSYDLPVASRTCTVCVDCAHRASSIMSRGRLCQKRARPGLCVRGKTALEGGSTKIRNDSPARRSA